MNSFSWLPGFLIKSCPGNPPWPPCRPVSPCDWRASLTLTFYWHCGGQTAHMASIMMNKVQEHDNRLDQIESKLEELEKRVAGLEKLARPSENSAKGFGSIGTKML